MKDEGAPIMAVTVNGSVNLFGDVTEQLTPLPIMSWM